jgi:hypothetical protein
MITKEGPLIKAPVTGIEVILQGNLFFYILCFNWQYLLDGSTHIVDTTDMAMIATMVSFLR